MDKTSFLNRFSLSSNLLEKEKNRLNTSLRKAAVLIVLVERKDGLHLIFTERALHLRHHPGQVSFPGGKYEESDKNLRATALRETEEEIGISNHLLTVCGALPSLETVSGFSVHPFIAFADNSYLLRIDYEEVKSVFEVPLAYLLDSNHFHKEHLIANKKRHFTYCVAYQNHLIWGATAQILKSLQLSLI